MDVNRLRRGELIAGASGVVLFILMFLNWFGIDREDAADFDPEDAEDLAEVALDQGLTAASTSLELNAWESFSFIDLILAVTVIVAVGLAVATAVSRTVSLPVAASALTAGLGILSVLLILFRIIDTPYGLDREFGVFLGLIAAAGVAYGGWLSMQEEGTTFAGEADRLGDRFDDDRPAGPPPGGPPAGGPPSGGAPPPGGPTV